MPEIANLKNIAEFQDKSLLIVDDDNPFRERLARAMEKKGFVVTQAESVKKGIDSLKISKPADADDVEKALLADPKSKAQPPENPMTADRVKWEHIHRVFELCNRNVSETARRLKMHRRTLQRILSKRSPR